MYVQHRHELGGNKSPTSTVDANYIQIKFLNKFC